LEEEKGLVGGKLKPPPRNEVARKWEGEVCPNLPAPQIWKGGV